MTGKLPIQVMGTGMYVPSRVVDNEEFCRRLDTSDEWIVTRTGIHERRWADQKEYSSTLASHACRSALSDAGVAPTDLDLIICATATGDCPFPATAAFIQRDLGAVNVPAFDVSAACAGFLYGTIVAGQFLSTGNYRRVLVVGTETLSRFADPEDRATIVLFGDAAGAAVLSPTESPDRGVLYYEFGCDGTRAEHIWLPAGGSRFPASEKTVAERLHFMRMRGREVYKFAVLKMEELIDRALCETCLRADDLKLIIPHQSNLRIIESVRERLGLPREKMAVNIDRYGNTSAASVPMALDAARRDGTLVEGDTVLMVAIGAGITWSTIVLRL